MGGCMSDPIHYLPIMLDCRDQDCLIVGGGKVAERKSISLLQAGAILTIISPTVTAKLQQLIDQQQIRWLDREYQTDDIANCAFSDKKLSEIGYRPYFLVYAVTSVPEINNQVAAEAKAYRIPVNVAHQREQSTFINPNVIRRGRLTIAVATSGAGPLAGRHIAKEINQHFGNEYEIYIDFLYHVRETIAKQVSEESLRKSLLHQAMSLSILEDIRQGVFEPWSEQQIQHWINQSIEE